MPASTRPQYKLKPAFNRGFTPQQKAMMEAIVLPKQLRCNDCNKLTNVSGFSEKQCKDLRYNIVTRHVNAAKLEEEAWLRCRKCTGVQSTEMECIMCETVKGYDDFAKNQRKNRDRAICVSCAWDVEHETIIENTAVDAFGGSEDGDEGDGDSDGTSNVHEHSVFDESENGGAPLSGFALSDANLRTFDNSTTSRSSRPSGTMAAKTLSGGNSGIVSGPANMASVDPWKAMSKQNGGSVADSTSGAQFTGYDAAGGSHQKVRAPSTVASDHSNETTTAYPTTAAASYDYKAEKAARSKFAKVPGQGRLVARPQTHTGRTLPARHDSDEEEADDEYFTI